MEEEAARKAFQAEVSRREFMWAGSSTLLSLSGAAKGQITSGGAGGQPNEEYTFQGVADLMGPASARPAATSDFFDNKVFYAYRYEATDTGARSFITQGDVSWQELPLEMAKYSTPYDALKTAQQYTQFALDPSKGQSRRRYQWFSDNVLFDESHVNENDANGTIDLSTGGTAANTVRMHSAVSGQYLSQSLAQPGVGLDVAQSNVSYSNGLVSLSHGTMAVGVGWHDKSAGGWGVGGPVQTFLGIVLKPSGAEAHLIANGSHIGGSPVSQENWNLDVMDGTDNGDNPSGLQFRPDDGYVYQFPYTWYAHGTLYVGVSHPKTDDLLNFHQFNVDQATFDRPNVPTTVILDDGGTAADLTARVGGMQYALYGSDLGNAGSEERGIDVTKTDFAVTTPSVDSNGSVDPIAEPGDPVISFRRQASVRDLALRLDNLFAELNNPIWVYSWDEYDPATALTNANFRNPNEAVHPDDETLIEVDTAATDYTPTTAVGRGIDYIYTDKNQDSLEQLPTDDRIPIDATRVITATTEGTEATVDPAQIRIIEGY